MLEELIRSLSRPLDPEATEETPRLRRLPGIRAVIFDVYGTLFISDSGDIGLTQDLERARPLREALEACDIELNSQAPAYALRWQELIVHARDKAQAAGQPYPEVEIRELWRRFLEELRAEEIHNQDVSRDLVERVAIEYECRANPVWPMPELRPTLETLQDRRLKLGIVSNAQFYTPLLFSAFLHRSLLELGFASDLLHYSYEKRVGKPSTRLYQDLVENLRQRHGIQPTEALYIGNDLRNDIWPAQEVGLRTALFAGDQRSLRWRREDERLRNVIPDLILTRLSQVLEAV